MHFEYKVLKREIRGFLGKDSSKHTESELNQLGQDGWELVGTSMKIVTGSSNEIFLFLKREVT